MADNQKTNESPPGPLRHMGKAKQQGRSGNVLTFATQSGEKVSIPPLAFEVDHVPGVEVFQIVQRTPTNLIVRLKLDAGADSEAAWRQVVREIRELLARHNLRGVDVERDAKPPEQSAGEKYRTVATPVNSDSQGSAQ